MLKAINTPKRLKQRFPHLANFHAYQVELDKKTIKTWLKSALAVGQLDSNNTIFNSTFEQMANIIDAIYTSGINDANEIRDLGATITSEEVTFKLWTPTAKAVNLQLFDLESAENHIGNVAMWR